MRRVRCGQENFDAEIERLSRSGADALSDAEPAVRAIVERVREGGDAALIELTRELDGVSLEEAGFWVGEEEMARAAAALPPETLDALELAAGRIRAFHEVQVPRRITLEPAPGERLSLLPAPLASVGLYAPGGTAAYPSTVLMNAIPARAAGVEELVLCVPPGADGRIPDAALAAASLAGLSRVARVGGAQAVAAMAYGTESVPRVDKIAGPGGVHVAAAKRVVRGEVEIDKEAGPSEVVVLLDDPVLAEWAAADLLAQAEHDARAMAVGVCVGEAAADALLREVERQLRLMGRREAASRALGSRGAVIEARSREEALEAAERLAPEHLQILLEDAEEAAAGVRRAGAVFCGPWSPAALGDYLAGPNHVLPTGGAARFASPLGVHDFIKWRSEARFDAAAAARLAGPAARLADLEGLPAHARALRLRLAAPRGDAGGAGADQA